MADTAVAEEVAEETSSKRESHYKRSQMVRVSFHDDVPDSVVSRLNIARWLSGAVEALAKDGNDLTIRNRQKGAGIDAVTKAGYVPLVIEPSAVSAATQRVPKAVQDMLTAIDAAGKLDAAREKAAVKGLTLEEWAAERLEAVQAAAFKRLTAEI